MVLALGIVVGVAGYTVLVWGVNMVERRPTTFAYLIGMTDTNLAAPGTNPVPAITAGARAALAGNP